MLSFLPTAKKSLRQTGDNNFRNKSCFSAKMTIKQYAKAELLTVSVAVAASAW